MNGLEGGRDRIAACKSCFRLCFVACLSTRCVRSRILAEHIETTAPKTSSSISTVNRHRTLCGLENNPPCGAWLSNKNIFSKPASMFLNVWRLSPYWAELTATRTFKAGFFGHSWRQSAGIRLGSSFVHDKNASVLHKSRSLSKGREYCLEKDDDEPQCG